MTIDELRLPNQIEHHSLKEDDTTVTTSGVVDKENFCQHCIILLIICGIASNLTIYAHFFSHFFAHLGFNRFLTTLLLSACSLVIINLEGTLIVLSIILTDNAYHWLESSTIFCVFNVILQLCTLYLLHYIVIMYILRLLCLSVILNTPRTLKIFGGTLLALMCSSLIIVLSSFDCYYQFNKTLWYFAYKCNESTTKKGVFPLTLLAFEPLILYFFCQVVLCCCAPKKKDVSDRRARRLRESAIGGVSVISANIDSVPSNQANQKEWEKHQRIFAQTKYNVVIFLLFLDAIIRLILPFQTQIAFFFNGERDELTNYNKNINGATELDDSKVVNKFTANNSKFVESHIDLLALFLNFLHFLLLGVAIPICHFLENRRLRTAFPKVLKYIVTIITCHRQNEKRK